MMLLKEFLSQEKSTTVTVDSQGNSSQRGEHKAQRVRNRETAVQSKKETFGATWKV